MTPMNDRNGVRGAAGFSLVELVVSMAVMTVIMGAVMAAMSQATRMNQTAVMVTSMNSNLRTAMDLVVRDMLQVGQDLPTGRVVSIPWNGTVTVKLPGPPGTAFTTVATETVLSAVRPGPGLGPTVNGVATDMITTLAADSSFSNVDLTGLSNTSMTVMAPPSPANPAFNGINISNGGVDDILPGQLIMLAKGSFSTLVQVTAVSGQVVTFADSDSLNLNRSTVTAGTLRALNTGAPVLAPSPADAVQTANAIAQTQATRIRMITYYIDATTTPLRPRLVRRMNNGSATTFDNTSGSVVAFDIENLQITYDLDNDATNPTNVRMVAADLTTSGACSPSACSPNQIRKVNVLLTGRSNIKFDPLKQFYRNSLVSQVSLRSLAFTDKYTSTPP